MAWALETAETIAATVPAVQAVKRADQLDGRRPCAFARGARTGLGDRVRASVYFREGVAAFREKRAPRYD